MSDPDAEVCKSHPWRFNAICTISNTPTEIWFESKAGAEYFAKGMAQFYIDVKIECVAPSQEPT